MSFKIAIASNDGQTIDVHFGRARRFFIFDLAEEHFKLSEVRVMDSPSESEGQHDMEFIKNLTELLSDCRMVLASRIGPAVIEIFRLKGIQCYAMTGLIHPVLEKLAASFEVKNYLKTQDRFRI